MNSRRKHTSPKNGGEGPGGTRPQAHTWVRQIVACDNIVLDRQIVAWAVARGRRAQGHRLKQKKTQVRHIADLILNLKMRSSNYVKFNKWRKYGIKIRLHKYRLQQLDQRGPQNCSWLLLDSDGSGDAGRNRKELERNFIPDLIFTKNRKRTMDRGPGDKGHNWMAEKAYWIWNQCWRKIQSQMATSSNQLFGSRCSSGRRTRIAEIVSTSNPGRAPAWVFLYSNKKINKIRPQAHN